MSKEAPFLALVSLCPYIWLAITLCEGSMVEKCMYGPINKSCDLFKSFQSDYISMDYHK